MYKITYENGLPVGFASGAEAGGEAELYRLAVVPERRRNGIGGSLLREFLLECERRGAEKVFLEVRSKNEPAVSLYRRAGFRETAVRKDYYGDDDAVIMEFEINQKGEWRKCQH